MTRPVLSIALFGHPLGHSRSRELFDALAAAGGPQVRYTPVDVPPEAFADALARLRGGEWDGAAVTIPHKEAASQAVEEADALTRHARAANVLLRREGGLLRAANTDGPGFLDALAGRHEPRRAVVFGAGGAARAVALALAGAGAEVHLVARDPRAAQQRFAGDAPRVIGWGNPHVTDLLRVADLVVQGTSLGTWPHLNDVPPVPWDALRHDAFAVDLVYNPWETRFLAHVRQLGLAGMNGWGMLVCQAARALDLWHGPDHGPALVAAARTVEPRDPARP